MVRILSEEEARNAAKEPDWYLNHHMVERPDKLRIVLDSAAKYMGVCLNDVFEKGPTFTRRLLDVYYYGVERSMQSLEISKKYLIRFLS